MNEMSGLRTSFRNLLKHKGFTAINMVGLAVGLACVMFISLWVADELAYNRHHPDLDRIWQVKEHQTYANGTIFTTNSTPGVLAEEMRNVLPEVVHATVYTWQQTHLFGTGPDAVRRDGLYADHEFLLVFGWPVLEGDAATALKEPFSLVLTRQLADHLFPEGGALGQTVIVNDRTPHRVTAVVEDPPSASQFDFQYLLPFDDFRNENAWLNEWGNNGPSTVVKLHAGVDGAALSDRLKDFIRDRNEGSLVDVFLQPWSEVYLYGRFRDGRNVGGPIDTVRLFAMIAGFVLLIACINFMNLSTARSATRAREVGVRKSLGASRGSIAAQFIAESVLICLLAMGMALILVELLLPWFNTVTGKTASLPYTDIRLWMAVVGFSLTTGLLAGSYPAWVLSSFQAVDVLKGVIRHAPSGRFIRKGLVVVQFAISMVLIVGTIVITRQIGHIRNHDLGYDKEHVGFVPLEGALRDPDARLRFRDQVRNLPGVVNAGLSNSILVSRNSNTSSVRWPNKPPDTDILFEVMPVDAYLPETMGFEVVKGQGFLQERPGLDDRVLINEAAAKVIGIDDIIGAPLYVWGQDREIVGVVKDFHFSSLHMQVEPLILVVIPSSAWVAMIRLEPSAQVETLEAIQAVYKQFNPSYPFDFTFQDERVDRLYWREALMATLSRWFGGVAILVSCLGLFGLSVFTAEQRSKEIGIRKVNGATVSNLVMMLTGEFTRLVAAAILIATPLAWWLMNRWLDTFSYRVDVGWTSLAAAAAGSLLLAWITVGGQSLKAAIANPASVLRNE